MKLRAKPRLSSFAGMSKTKPTAPTAGSVAIISMAVLIKPGSTIAPPVRSSGLLGVAKLGRASASACLVLALSSGIHKPSSSAWSTAISHRPPDMASKASPLAPGLILPNWAMRSVVTISCSKECTRTIPSFLHRALNTASSPTSEPVWACAALAAASLLPTFKTTIVLPAALAASAARINAAGSRTDSKNRAMALGSS